MSTASIPTKSYPRQYRMIWEEVRRAIEHTVFEDEPILGAAVARFEAALARYHGVRSAIGVGSGTDAIVLALRALDLGGAEVITCAHTFAGVLSAILLAGARPVLVDADPRTGLLPPDAARAAITPRTRAILAVHFHGHPADAEALAAIAKERGLVLLEDAAQAHGARLRGRAVGSFGTAAILSFHPSKNLGAFGDGGAILTSDPALDARLRVARNLGKEDKHRFTAIAPNSKLDTLQAAILEVKLEHLDAWVERRRRLAGLYLEGLEGLEGLSLPREHPEATHAYHLFVVHTERRDALRVHLARHGIKTGVHYPIAAHLQPALAPYFPGASFPVAERLAATTLSLPLSHEHEDAEILRTIEQIRAFHGR